MRPIPDLEAAFADHDRLFKELLTIFFADFLALFAPALAARIDADSAVFLNQEVFADVTDGSRRIVDLLVRVKMRGDDGQEVFILIHIENQSKVEARFARRMFLITARLDEKYDLPVYPIAVFSFDAPARKEPDRYRVAFPGRTVLQFQFESIQLNRLNWRTFLKNSNPVAAALMSKMKIARRDRPRVKLECLRMIATLKLDPVRTQLLSGFVDSYLRLNADESAIFSKAIAALPQEEREATMPLTISWKEEGLAQGLVQGREEGRTEGSTDEARRMLVLFGQKRLGAPSTDMSERLNQIVSLARLEFLAQNIADVETWDELFAPPE